MSQTPTDASSRSAFVTTRWTQVLSARGASSEAQLALGQLCDAYWMPVFRFIRRTNHSDDSARELTQEFFTQILTHRGLDSVEQGKGRFRSYLLGAVKHFLSDQKDRDNALKRGGAQDQGALPDQPPSATTAVLQVPDPRTPPPDSFFDRHWALNVVERALSALSAELTTDGKLRHFEVLKPWLVGDVNSFSQADAAQMLEISEGAVKVSIHRLRKRFRELVKEEISGTLDPQQSFREELHYLLEALAQ